MRVLLLCHGLPPESVGGVAQPVAGLAGALVDPGHDVHVLARTGDPARAQGALYREAAGNPAITRCVYRWEGLHDLHSIYTCPPMAATLRQFLAAERAQGRAFDVAHVHHLTGLSTDAMSVFAEFATPVVLTLHDYWLLCPRGQMWHHRGEVCERVEAARCGECLALTFPHWVTLQSGPEVAAAV